MKNHRHITAKKLPAPSLKAKLDPRLQSDRHKYMIGNRSWSKIPKPTLWYQCPAVQGDGDEAGGVS